ncbi:MAG: hypothetical protein JO113_03890 [Candidatus Eremiobacteraeota bacterium]|nr:hypothetical protein [Candidatus Eremiobacteraeota bacterium]
MSARSAYHLSLALAFATLAGCAGASTPRSGGGGLMPAFSSPDTSLPAPAVKVKITGTYHGSISETQGGKTHSGTVTIKLTQSRKKVSGTFTVYYGSQSAELAITGTVKSQSKKKASLAIELCPPKGACATGTATVTRTKLSGKATVTPKGKPTIYITFATRRESTDS